MASHSQLVPSYSNANMESSASDHVSSDNTEQNGSNNEESKDSEEGKNTNQKQPESSVVAPLFVPSHVIPPPWWTQGSPVFVDPSSGSSIPQNNDHSNNNDNNNHEKTSASLSVPQHTEPMPLPSILQNQPSSSSLPSSPSSFTHTGSPPQFAMPNYMNDKNFVPLYQPAQETFRGVPWQENDQIMSHSSIMPNIMTSAMNNIPMYDYSGFLIPPEMRDVNKMGNTSNVENIHLAMPSPTPGNMQGPDKTRDATRMPGINYIQPIISSVQKLIKNSRPSISLASLEEGIRERGQKMMASYSSIVPVVTNYTAHLPSLPSLPSLPANLARPNISALWHLVERNNNDHNRGKENSQRSRYLESLRTRIRPVSISVDSLRMAPLLNAIMRNVRRVRSPNSRSRNHRRGGRQFRSSLANDPALQQYLEQILSSKWWEWPSGGLLGPSLNQY